LYLIFKLFKVVGGWIIELFVEDEPLDATEDVTSEAFDDTEAADTLVAVEDTTLDDVDEISDETDDGLLVDD